jgi:hypothetical protein
MSKYTSPEYGKEILSTVFTTEIVIRDYSKIEHCKDKYPMWGITVMGYSGTHKDLYARIHYLPSNEVVFNIEMDQNTWMESKWKNEDVDDSTYDYFGYIVKKVMLDFEVYQKRKKETYSDIKKFDSKYWLERQNKINSLI